MSVRSDYVGPLDFGEDPPEEVEVVVSIDDVARRKAFELAERQATDDEVTAALVRRFNWTRAQAEKLVEDHAEELHLARLDGRAELREWAYSVARGQAGGQLSSSQIAILQLLGSQHLGYTREGFDLKTRRLVERAEKQAAKNRRAGDR